MAACGGALILLVVTALVRLWLLRRRYAQIRHKLRKSSAKVVLGFFHPYCSGGGGGERVLWKMIQDIGGLCERGFSVQIVIYTVDPPSPTYQEQLLQQIQERFDLLISKQLQIQFVHLHAYAHYLQPAPRLSLLVESYGTMRLAMAALESTQSPLPDWFIDTTGCAFAFLVARLLYGCKIMAYVHYPTISTDMLQLVWERRRNAYNHSLANSRILTYGKLLYYCFFAVLYGITGSLAEIVFVNSQWTRAHIQYLWKWSHWKKRIRLLYPPCRVQQQTAVLQRPRDNVILSIGQFRPEKDHPLQIESFHRLIQKYPEWRGRVQLVLIGSCRGPGDEERLSRLCDLVQQYQLSEKDVHFVVNQPYSVLQQWLTRASVGIHTVRRKFYVPLLLFHV
ncbi:alpha-1,2-mannosyltransferase [Fistulifera solaris]|uniref:GDP-Man:Man(3)GlcNAc(2)-PP-Dol alpha-1,2-mannosyltransferase n=1 Tax=Fistulifera solaris TaxID=1519565 RepID=A0A1Z5JXC6_FISSO|nr:alpha-1,2-mannosyltransferase [Fistulifera solaris]|eukprot:GAX18690.1 alpha-1,2-mannosyltransferase [Fistulifera solaris]